MYLIEAEANYFLNDERCAQCIKSTDRRYGEDPGYNPTATGTDLLDEIKFYRAVELWGEGFDWFDMKRWGDTISRSQYSAGGNFIEALARTITPQENNQWTWRLPLRETDYNKGIGGPLPE